MTFKAFCNWFIKNPTATCDDAMAAFPKVGPEQIGAWHARYCVQRRYQEGS